MCNFKSGLLLVTFHFIHNRVEIPGPRSMKCKKAFISIERKSGASEMFTKRKNHHVHFKWFHKKKVFAWKWNDSLFSKAILSFGNVIFCCFVIYLMQWNGHLSIDCFQKNDATDVRMADSASLFLVCVPLLLLLFTRLNEEEKTEATFVCCRFVGLNKSYGFHCCTFNWYLFQL